MRKLEHPSTRSRHRALCLGRYTDRIRRKRQRLQKRLYL